MIDKKAEKTYELSTQDSLVASKVLTQKFLHIKNFAYWFTQEFKFLVKTFYTCTIAAIEFSKCLPYG